MFFPNIFDPLLVSSQIIMMQCVYYLSFGLYLLLFNLTAGTDVDLDYILSPSTMCFSHWYCWPPIAASALTIASW
jgi:hypothetical protein